MRSEHVGESTRPEPPARLFERSPASTEPLTEADVEFVEHARRIIDANTDDERGVHTVGAAVRDAAGTIHGGVNLYHFTGGPCAELVALGTARASGARAPTTIVAVGNEDRGRLAPCGRDRQVLRDYYPTIRVIIPTDDGPAVADIEDLLP